MHYTCKLFEHIIFTYISKAFDAVPHDGLPSKLKHYDIDDKIWLWIYNCLKRKQSVVVDGKHSILIYVVSGVPQGTVLDHPLFLLHINDLPSVVSSKVRLFAVDCLICVLMLPSAILREFHGHATQHFSTTH